MRKKNWEKISGKNRKNEKKKKLEKNMEENIVRVHHVCELKNAYMLILLITA